MVPICLYCLNCTEFGQLILRKIIKIVATRCQILRLKCTNFDFSTPTDPRGWIKGGLLLREGEEKREGRERVRGGVGEANLAYTTFRTLCRH